MSDRPQADDWWLASDGRWYPPQSAPDLPPPPGQDSFTVDRWDWRRIASFTGRTRRSEFWAAVGAAIAIGFVLRYLDAIILNSGGSVFGIITLGIWIWLVWGSAVNRMHDMGMSGWLTLLMLIPFVGLGIAIWVGSGPGKPVTNRWGPPVA